MKLAEVSFAVLDVIIGRWAQMAASLVLLSRGENSPIKAAPTAEPPVPVQKGLLSCLSACVATAELSSAIPIRGVMGTHPATFLLRWTSSFPFPRPSGP